MLLLILFDCINFFKKMNCFGVSFLFFLCLGKLWKKLGLQLGSMVLCEYKYANTVLALLVGH